MALSAAHIYFFPDGILPPSLMKIDRGIRDWDGHRLIVSLRENSN